MRDRDDAENWADALEGMKKKLCAEIGIGYVTQEDALKELAEDSPLLPFMSSAERAKYLRRFGAVVTDETISVRLLRHLNVPLRLLTNQGRATRKAILAMTK